MSSSANAGQDASIEGFWAVIGLTVYCTCSYYDFIEECSNFSEIDSHMVYFLFPASVIILSSSSTCRET